MTTRRTRSESIATISHTPPRNSPAANKQANSPAAKAEPSRFEMDSRPTPDQIRERAYFIYQNRGCTPGDPVQDWLQAERELSEMARRAMHHDGAGADW